MSNTAWDIDSVHYNMDDGFVPEPLDSDGLDIEAPEDYFPRTKSAVDEPVRWCQNVPSLLATVRQMNYMEKKDKWVVVPIDLALSLRSYVKRGIVNDCYIVSSQALHFLHAEN